MINQENMDNQETPQTDSREFLAKFCRRGFDNNFEQAALVLGRTSEQIKNILDKGENVDEDLEMKIRSIAEERNIQI